MLDLCEYEDIIIDEVEKADDEDRDWNWWVESVSKTKAKIVWGYLAFCNPSNPYFTLKLTSDRNGCVLHAVSEQNEFLDGEIVECKEHPDFNTPLKVAIQRMIASIVGIAHSAY